MLSRRANHRLVVDGRLVASCRCSVNARAASRAQCRARLILTMRGRSQPTWASVLLCAQACAFVCIRHPH